MLAILFIIFASTVFATVSIENALDAQYPLVARIGENYTWTMSIKTFATDLDASLVYTAQGLPGWLSFDTAALTFYGIPAAADEGQPSITVSASDSASSALSSFLLCVTSYPAPTLHVPLAQQFTASNHALSSVFVLAPGSALATEMPTLRVPARWSFSIGLDGDTFAASNDLYYGALQADLTPLPTWITFDASMLTLDGVAPSDDDGGCWPRVLDVIVYGSDQEGYSATSVGFRLVVASHELSAYATLPTVNVTAGTGFNVSMASAADFTGVLVDGQPVQPANVSILSIDVSAYSNWLNYDAERKTLFGTPPENWTVIDGQPTLSVTLTSTFNQTLYTSVALDVVPSFFTTSDLGVVQADPGYTVQFGLDKYFANASLAQHHVANLSASFNPPNASGYLTFDARTAQLTGRIPTDSNTPQICIMFVAYSDRTHSTSHALLSVQSPELERVKGGGGLGGPSKSQVTLIVSLVFGIIGGVFFLGFALAFFRRCARVKDSAVLGEEGIRAWTEEEKRWYGIGIEVRERQYERGYGWSNQADTSAASEKGSLETQTPVKEGSLEAEYPPSRSYLGLGLRRVPPRAPTTPQASCAEGVMKKAEFFGKIRDTARNVSDRYNFKRRSPPGRPTISRPVALTRRSELSGVPIEGQYVEIVKSPPPPPPMRVESVMSLGEGQADKRASTVVSFTTSPSNSTGERSIPRRRADFAPPNSPMGPRAPAPAAIKETSRSFARESMQSASGMSAESHPESLRPGEERPRLKQFTHASRVPPPRSPSSNVAEPDATSGARRIASQTAQVYKESQEGRHTSIDELRIGMHYVRTLGDNVRTVSEKSSFSSFGSSQPGNGLRFLARAGDAFSFRVPLPANTYRKLEARLMSGRALPAFVHAELTGKDEDKRAIEFYGVPKESDVGEMHVGVFNAESGACLVRVVVEVLKGKKT